MFHSPRRPSSSAITGEATPGVVNAGRVAPDADGIPGEPGDGGVRPVYYEVEDLPDLDVPLLSGPPPEPQFPGQIFQAGYDDGFYIRPTKGNEEKYPFDLKINGRIQFRPIGFADQDDSPRGDEFNFEIERARLVFSGHAFTPKLLYYVQFDGDGDDESFTEFIDYYFIYKFRDEIGVRVGQWKLPFTKQDTVSSSRLQFVDRSIADEVFNIDRSQGISVLGTLQKQLHYELAVINGFNTDNSTFNRTGDLDNNPAYTGRVYLDPFGNFGKHESDLEHHESPVVRIGGSAAFSQIDDAGIKELREFKLIDSGRRLADVVPGALDGFSVLLGAADASFKYRGFSLTGEWFVRHVRDFETATVGEMNAYGFYVQSGYFLIPKKFEIAARYSRVWGDKFRGHSRNSADEIGGAFNWYINGDDIKISFSAIHLNGAPLFSDTTGIQAGDDGMQYMGQLQLAF